MLSSDKLDSYQTRLLTFWLSGEKDRMPLMSICKGWAGEIGSKLAGTVVAAAAAAVAGDQGPSRPYARATTGSRSACSAL